MVTIRSAFTVILLAVFAHAAAAEEIPPPRAGQAPVWGPIDMQSAVVAPGTKEKSTFSTERSFEGGFLDAPLWTARGRSEGPTLCIVAGIHGDEINSVEIARRSFKAIDVRDGKVLWETRLATSVQGFPITFAVDGRQYVAVATGLGGGSPRGVPSIITPEIQPPSRGHALYVFALPR